MVWPREGAITMTDLRLWYDEEAEAVRARELYGTLDPGCGRLLLIS